MEKDFTRDMRSVGHYSPGDLQITVKNASWDSQIGRGIDSSYMQEVLTAARKHLLVKKSDAETSFYYMGLFDIVEARADKKMDNNGRDRDITKVKVKMRHAVRDDLLRYLQSNINEKAEENAG